jgi:hypothetical protein
MNMLKKLSTVPCLLLASLAVCAAPASAQKKPKDTIHKKSGGSLRAVEVLEMTISSIKYDRAGGGAGELPSFDLAGIDWFEPPEAFGLAAAAMARGDAETAANLFQEAAAQTQREVLKTECQFLGARALTLAMGNDKAKATAAITALQGFLDKAEKGFRSPEAKLLLGRAHRVNGDAEAAAKLFGEVESAAVAEGFGLIWQGKAKVEQALALRAQGKFNEARMAFQSAEQAIDSALTQPGPDAAELQSLKLLAVVGLGETYVEENKHDEAKRYFAGLAAKGGPARAAALAGEAHAIYLQALPKKDVPGLRTAQLKAAEATVADAASDEPTAKSLYLQGMILLALGPSAESDTYRTRAADYFDSVVRYYPNSPWAAAARTELRK